VAAAALLAIIAGMILPPPKPNTEYTLILYIAKLEPKRRLGLNSHDPVDSRATTLINVSSNTRFSER